MNDFWNWMYDWYWATACCERASDCPMLPSWACIVVFYSIILTPLILMERFDKRVIRRR